MSEEPRYQMTANEQQEALTRAEALRNDLLARHDGRITLESLKRIKITDHFRDEAGA